MYARSDRLVRIDDTFTCGHTLRQVRFRLASLFILLCVSFCPENVHLVWSSSVVLVSGIWRVDGKLQLVDPHHCGVSCCPSPFVYNDVHNCHGPTSISFQHIPCSNVSLLRSSITLQTFDHHVSQDETPVPLWRLCSPIVYRPSRVPSQWVLAPVLWVRAYKCIDNTIIPLSPTEQHLQ